MERISDSKGRARSWAMRKYRNWPKHCGKLMVPVERLHSDHPEDFTYGMFCQNTTCDYYGVTGGDRNGGGTSTTQSLPKPLRVLNHPQDMDWRNYRYEIRYAR